MVMNMHFFDSEHYIGSSSDISISRRTINENFDIHWHDFFEIEIVLGGKGTHNLNGTIYNLEEGSIYLLTPTDYHDVCPKNNLDIFNIMFNETLLSDEFLSLITSCKGNLFFKLENKELEEVKQLCNIMLEEYTQKNQYRESYIRNMLECFLIHILRKGELSVSKYKKSSIQIQRAIQYINLHFKDNPSLAEIASVVGSNPNYFCKKFKEETGMGYSDYLTERKLKYAKRLLKAGGFTVTEICFASGFTSMSNFMRVFKEKTGKNPTQYKNELK